MSLFINKDKTAKSPLVLHCFSLGLVFCFIFAGMYALLTEPLHTYVRIVNDTFSTTLHAVLIASAGTVVCCIFFMLRDKRIVPGAFTFLAIFLLVGYLMTFELSADRRNLMQHLLSLYGLGPILLGNAISWGIYFKMQRKQSSTDKNVSGYHDYTLKK